jgi:hypothetical protein
MRSNTSSQSANLLNRAVFQTTQSQPAEMERCLWSHILAAENLRRKQSDSHEREGDPASKASANMPPTSAGVYIRQVETERVIGL